MQEECSMGYFAPIKSLQGKIVIVFTQNNIRAAHFNSHSTEYPHRNCRFHIGSDVFSVVVKGINPSWQRADERRSTPWMSGQLMAGRRRRERVIYIYKVQL